MSNLLAYIRKNAMFVALLSVIVVCCIGFGISMLLHNDNNHVPSLPPQSDDPVVTNPKISSFEGSYGRDATVYLSWSITRGESDIESVKLYHEERQIGGEMKDLSSFSMAESLYQFPSGNCTFTLQVTFSDGTSDRRDVQVYIYNVMDIQMNTEKVEDGILLKLSYIYDENNPVDVPRVKFIAGSQNPFKLSYQETKKSQNGAMVYAETIFKLNTNQLSKGSYPITIRWIFDGANISKDFEITVEK